MTTHRWIVIGVTVVAWFLTCAGVTESQTATRPSVVSIPDFRLEVPRGEWSIERDVASRHITLLERSARTLGPTYDVRIDVRIARPDSTSRLTPAAAARLAVDTVLSSVRSRAGAKWTYTTSARDTTIGCRILSGADYRLASSRGTRTVGDEQGTVYAWAPPEYPLSGRVVVFRLTMVTRQASGIRLRSDEPFYDVIQGLELQSTPEAIIC